MAATTRIGTLIHNCRRGRGMSQAALARKAQVAQPRVCAIETGETVTPVGETLVKIASALDMDPLSLFNALLPAGFDELTYTPPTVRITDAAVEAGAAALDAALSAHPTVRSHSNVIVADVLRVALEAAGVAATRAVATPPGAYDAGGRLVRHWRKLA